MKYTLCSTNPEMIEAWKVCFKEYPEVVIKKKNIVKINSDAVVSSANSFGYMDGGLDLALSEHFGWQIQEELITRIKQLPMRELLVGQTMVIETKDKKTPYLISCPTMRIPSSHNIPESVNAYLCMKATLITAKDHTEINSVSIPAFCAGVGEMPVEIVARQMLWAYLEIELERQVKHDSFHEVRDLHFLLTS
jgi:O-acetyl-ADP-ribose deacetylase (regulator of RNase III)